MSILVATSDRTYAQNLQNYLNSNNISNVHIVRSIQSMNHAIHKTRKIFQKWNPFDTSLKPENIACSDNIEAILIDNNLVWMSNSPSSQIEQCGFNYARDVKKFNKKIIFVSLGKPESPIKWDKYKNIFSAYVENYKQVKPEETLEIIKYIFQNRKKIQSKMGPIASTPVSP